MSTGQHTADFSAGLTRARLSQRSITLLVLFLYIALAVSMTWSVASQLGTRLAGGRADLMMHQWTFWWVKEALRQGVDALYTTSIFYPNGVSLLFHNVAWFISTSITTVKIVSIRNKIVLFVNFVSIFLLSFGENLLIRKVLLTFLRVHLHDKKNNR